MNTQRCLIFLHVPKTAGRTLESIIAWKFRNEGIIRLGIERPVEELENAAENVKERARVVMGHVPFGVHRYVPRDCDYITVLREPVSRVVSTYRHILAHTGHHLHDHVVKMDLEEYVSSDINSPVVENAQTRQIAGLDFEAVVDRGSLEIAMKNLETFLVIGLTERFDESFILLRRALGWRFPFYVTRNVSPRWTQNMAVSERAIQFIRGRNSLDLELYEFAKALLERDVEAGGRSFHREVAVFKALNRIPDTIGRSAEGLVKAYLRFPLRAKVHRGP